ncbi:MAG: hypothetical protein ACKOC2_00210 [Gemmatimonadota bacterium]
MMHRNAGQPLDLERVRAIRVNRSAAERRAATEIPLPSRARTAVSTQR